MDNFVNQKCIPCEGGIAPLSKSEAEETMKHIPGWVLAENRNHITRKFTFRDFVEAMAFVNKVADLAEKEGHHPDIGIHWNKVGLHLWTHAIGGLSTNDFIIAAKVNAL